MGVAQVPMAFYLDRELYYKAIFLHVSPRAATAGSDPVDAPGGMLPPSWLEVCCCFCDGGSSLDSVCSFCVYCSI